MVSNVASCASVQCRRALQPADRRTVRMSVVLVALLAWVAARAAPPLAKIRRSEPPQSGRFVRLTLPVTGQTFERTRRIVRRVIEGPRRKMAGWC